MATSVPPNANALSREAAEEVTHFLNLTAEEGLSRIKINVDLLDDEIVAVVDSYVVLEPSGNFLNLRPTNDFLAFRTEATERIILSRIMEHTLSPLGNWSWDVINDTLTQG